MVAQYPHSLFVHSVGDSTQDANGSWSEPTENWQLHSVCREETNGRGNVVRTQDGQSIVFSSTIYMPLGTARIAEGTEVQVREAGTDLQAGFTRIQKPVLKFEQGQLNCRIWL